LAEADESYPLSTPRPGWSEQKPDDWVGAAEAVLARLPKADRIGLSGQMHGLVCLDEAGTPLRPAILWNDQRTAAECAEIESRVGLERLIELTGNRALTGFTAPKLLWVRNNEPDVYSQITHILLPKDYVRYRLTGVEAIDAADASGTLLFDVAKRRWSDEVLEALDVPREWLPPVYESPDVPEIPGAGDQAAALLGVGVTEPGPVSVVLGTSGTVSAALSEFAADSQARVHVFCHSVPGRWHAMGVMLSAAASLRWLRDLLDVPYEMLLAEAERWPPGSEGLLFAPYLAGERTPHADPSVRASFVGLSLRHDRGALVRAVLEGVAYGLRDSLELLGELGVRPAAIRLSGGGARSELWQKIVAAVFELPVELTGSEEASAFGAALLASADPIAAAKGSVRVRMHIDPEPAWARDYAAGYEHFRELYPAIRAF
jgi:xylulokinase